MQFTPTVEDFDRRQRNDLTARQISWQLERHLSSYGYDRVETPIVQPSELFLTKAGDQIVTRLFTFERAGRELTLRPEFTASAAQIYVTHFPDGRQIKRWQFHGHVFEDDAATLAHFQRFTVGAELVGANGADADAEILAMSAHGLAQLGLTDWFIEIGNIQLLYRLMEKFALDSRTLRFLLAHTHLLNDPSQGAAALQATLDQLFSGTADTDDDEHAVQSLATDDNQVVYNTQYMLDVLLDATQRGVTMGGRSRHDIVRRLLQKRQRAAERTQIAAAIQFLAIYNSIYAHPNDAFQQIEELLTSEDGDARHILTEWRRALQLLDMYGVPAERIKLRPALSRPWDYYTGILFDLNTSDGTRLGGGGRYDELARLLGGSTDVPAVGFVLYADTLAKYLPQITAMSRLQICCQTDLIPTGIRWAERLRAEGVAVELNIIDTQPGCASIQSDGSILWNSIRYQLDEFETLLASLKELN